MQLSTRTRNISVTIGWISIITITFVETELWRILKKNNLKLVSWGHWHLRLGRQRKIDKTILVYTFFDFFSRKSFKQVWLETRFLRFFFYSGSGSSLLWESCTISANRSLINHIAERNKKLRCLPKQTGLLHSLVIVSDPLQPEPSEVRRMRMRLFTPLTHDVEHELQGCHGDQ